MEPLTNYTLQLIFYFMMIMLYLSNFRKRVHTTSTITSLKGRFIWLLGFFHVAENPTEYNLSNYLPIMYTYGILLLLIIGLVYFFSDVLYRVRTKCFIYALNNPLFCHIINFYCYRVLVLRGLFEADHYLVVGFMASPGFIFPVAYIMQDPVLSNPFLWVAFWFSLGIIFTTLDQQGSLISQTLDEEPEHPFSKTFTAYLKAYSSKSIYLDKGWGILAGKLSAAGQAAVYAGIATCITGLGIASINVAYNIDRDNKNRKERRKERREERKYQSAENQRNRDHQSAENKANHDREDQRAQANRDWQDQKDRQKAYDSSWNFFKKPPK